MTRIIAPVVLALATGVLLDGCATIAADPEARRLNSAVEQQASTFYAALPAKAAPDCGFDASAPTYAAMRADAAAMEAHTPEKDRAMRRAAAALTHVIDESARSHQLASASTDDRFGACMAPGAITLNADAVARATQTIERLQRERGAKGER
ncbi:MAG: hypothetical protein DI544_12555 [Sphingomonas taxi]|uniref:Lipoprotein n=1 Tax=Sphingomonas taxi TaxID=1549858 RepID=A0A2W5P357_9SPHN|nr:MAG: hypothetical protein DI544_12555 [Sphingomonas taxi]